MSADKYKELEELVTAEDEAEEDGDIAGASPPNLIEESPTNLEEATLTLSPNEPLVSSTDSPADDAHEQKEEVAVDIEKLSDVTNKAQKKVLEPLQGREPQQSTSFHAPDIAMQASCDPPGPQYDLEVVVDKSKQVDVPATSGETSETQKTSVGIDENKNEDGETGPLPQKGQNEDSDKPPADSSNADDWKRWMSSQTAGFS